MNKIKLVALDLDGTTLDTNRRISECTKSVLENKIQEGVNIIAATGRPRHSVPEEFLKVEGVRYLLTCNGARIVDMQENKVLYEKMLLKEEVVNMIKIARKFDTYYEAIIDGIGYTEQKMIDNLVEYGWMEHMTSYILKTRKIVNDIEETVLNTKSGIDKFQIVIKDSERRMLAIKEFEKLGAYEMDSAFERNIEITAPGVNKGSGVRKIAEILEIPIEQVMAIGDGMNDYTMISEAGIGVAMKNAVQEIKEIADYITDTNDEDGVAKAILHFCQ